MVRNRDGEAVDAGILRQPSGHRPGPQDTTLRETQIEMVPGAAVLMQNESRPVASVRRPAF